ncbi:MAG: DoxX family membrane protein [Leptospirales bacterium]|jgi:putative oxidoreductase
MKIATIIVRVLLGLLFVFGAVAYFGNLFPPPELSGAMKVFNDGLEASVYIMPVVKTVELICGVALILNRFVPLATVVIFPIVVNIVGVHVFLAPDGLPVALFVLFATLFLVFVHRDRYAELLASR